MEKTYREELVGLFGYPVDENPTVVIAQEAFRDLGVNFRYITMEVLPENLETALKALPALQFRGLHLTIPHKVAAIPFLDSIADDAALMGAVNTIVVRDGKLHGENTDGKGFIQSLDDAGIPVAGKKITMLGAGGAARAIAVELANHGASSLVIYNRSETRGNELASLINKRTSLKAEYRPWNKTAAIDPDTDILVNCTSIGLYPNVDEKPDIDFDSLKPSMVVCDVIPNHPHTQLLKEAEARGLKTLDGLGMLVNQGIESFRMWTGGTANADRLRRVLAREYGIEE